MHSRLVVVSSPISPDGTAKACGGYGMHGGGSVSGPIAAHCAPQASPYVRPRLGSAHLLTGATTQPRQQLPQAQPVVQQPLLSQTQHHSQATPAYIPSQWVLPATRVTVHSQPPPATSLNWAVASAQPVAASSSVSSTLASAAAPLSAVSLSVNSPKKQAQGSSKPQKALPLSKSLTLPSQNSPSQTAATTVIGTDVPSPLVSGEVTTIGRRRFRIGGIVGEGAYAQVYAAQIVGDRHEGENVAVKELQCGEGPGILPDASLQRAMFEVQVMQKLGEFVPEAGSPSRGRRCASDGANAEEEIRAPRVLEHQFWRLTPAVPSSQEGSGDGSTSSSGGAFLCRVAMTRLPGKSLALWLEERDNLVGADVDIAAAQSRDGTVLYCACFLNAALFARELLTQLGPTMARLNGGIAYHRDVNARNLLVHVRGDNPSRSSTKAALRRPPNASQLEFSLVDFGSSVDAKSWLAPSDTPGSWEVEHPTGDARYWGPASWLGFLFGSEALAQEPKLQRAYTRRLDLLALALCALEALMRLHIVDFSVSTPETRATSFFTRLATQLQRLHESWSVYYDMAIRSFTRLSEYSRTSCFGDQTRAWEIWQELVSSNIPHLLMDKFAALREELTLSAELLKTAQPDAAQALRALAVRGAADVDEDECRYFAELAGMSGSCAEVVDGVGPSCRGSGNVFMEVGRVLEVLREAIDENSYMEWVELVERLGPPRAIPRRRSTQLAIASESSSPARRSDGAHQGVLATATVTAVASTAPTSTSGPLAVASPLRAGRSTLKARDDVVVACGRSDAPGGAAPRGGSMSRLPRQQSSPSGTPAEARSMRVVRAQSQPLPVEEQEQIMDKSIQIPSAVDFGGGTGDDDNDESSMEAFLILRQVETEVRMLKRWYTEAIEVIKESSSQAGSNTK
eukprot:TRINITY_DN38224_c0_g1_i1.p1 TRINITY_DN38224_c0_g1~~TRINITY_DN38224_c0_g1_i1.p1  ORF type:complete len:911 (-),score=131.35 TRINITY_DN38224_c0_g1_i1:137-2869(-)